ncbi:MAG: dihydrolipoamide acetyltransferase [Deltaproteobacteria bacterium]|nr:dihydrolipoamide acetyltransferase [Deltaproteobacteria bacterium]
MNRAWLLLLPLVLLTSEASAQEAPPDPVPAVEGETAAPSAEAKPAPPAASSAGSTDGAPSYEVRLRGLQERVDDLKSRVFDSKTRLLILGEQVLNNLIADARAVIYHVNEASTILTLEEVLYFLDNNKIYYQSNRDGVLDKQRDFSIYGGSISPGNHLLSVELVYRGNGKVFTYLSGYVFRVKSSFNFYAAKGHETRVRSIGYEKGGMATRLEDRPSVRFEMERVKVSTDMPIGGVDKTPADGGGEGTK